jgi:hypothetical protein
VACSPSPKYEKKAKWADHLAQSRKWWYILYSLDSVTALLKRRAIDKGRRDTDHWPDMRVKLTKLGMASTEKPGNRVCRTMEKGQVWEQKSECQNLARDISLTNSLEKHRTPQPPPAPDRPPQPPSAPNGPPRPPSAPNGPPQPPPAPDRPPQPPPAPNGPPQAPPPRIYNGMEIDEVAQMD